MSRKEWIAVLVVIGLGIVWQIPRHDGMAGGERHEHPTAEAPAEPVADEGVGAPGTATDAEVAGPYRTIALEVTGMT